jgi:hypothetical protein
MGHQGIMELVSFPLRYTFREFCVNYLSVRVINNIFIGHGIEPSELSQEKLVEFSSSRRITVEKFYASIDWTSRQSVQRFLNILSFVLAESLGSINEGEKNRLHELCMKDGFHIEENTVSFNDLHGVKGTVKNLIFAAKGPKPEIVLIDSVNNDIQIVRNEQYCLIYDKPIPEYGLLWKDLTEWWREQDGIGNLTSRELENNLYQRLGKTLESEP